MPREMKRSRIRASAEATCVHLRGDAMDATIDMAEFLELVVYVLENTDLLPGDARLHFMAAVEFGRMADGWNEGGRRLLLGPQMKHWVSIGHGLTPNEAAG